MSTVPSPSNHPPSDHRDLRHADRSHRAGLPSVGVYPVGVPQRLDIPNIAACGLLERAARRLPNHPATIFFEQTLTYGEVQDAAQRLATWLQRSGIHSGERVGVLLPNCPEYLIALNAIWMAGGVAVAISPLSTAEDVAGLLTLTDCKTVISLDLLLPLIVDDEGHVETRKILQTSLCGYLPAWKRPLYRFARMRKCASANAQLSRINSFWDVIGGTSPGLVPVERLPAQDPAYILSTGGTTGDPKAVTLSHRNIVANAWQQWYWSGASLGEERLMAVLPFFHSYGMSTMLAAGAAMGATLIMQPRFQVTAVLKAVDRHQPTVFHAVPAMLAALNDRLRKKPARGLQSLKWVISGGASLPVKTASEFAEHSGALVVEGYGLSEASPVTHVGPLDGSNVSGSIGLPLPNTECRLIRLDREEHEEVADGEVGELWVRGPQVMLGYWQNDRATKQTITPDGWLKTGDLAKCGPTGFYEIVDRKKDLIITSGFNVYPADVEQVLRECPEIQDVAVIGVADPTRGEVVKACVVLRRGASWSQSRLEKFSRQRLAKHRQPRIWEHIKTDLPRNFLGKVIRRRLR